MTDTKKQKLDNSTFIFSSNTIFIQELYNKYLQNPGLVSNEWQEYFSKIGDDLNSLENDFDGASWNQNKLQVVGAVAEEAKQNKALPKDKTLAGSDRDYKIARLINRYRKYAHYAADLDPLGMCTPEFNPVLTPEYHSISNKELAGKYEISHEDNFANRSGNDIINKLQKIYCSKLAFEFEYISSVEEKIWLRNFIEDDKNDLSIVSNEDKKNSLNHLHRAASFEQTLHNDTVMPLVSLVSTQFVNTLACS